jgi:beta-phosphoglucomutase-like phosphatase (HAD superfamily)
VGERTLEAVLLDMDGLLVDTEPLWTIAEHELAARLGGEFTPAMKTAMIGMGVDAAVPLMLEMLGRPDIDPWAAGELMVARVAELFREPGAVIGQPGADDLLNALADADVPYALVSSSFRVLVDPVLAVLGHHRFAATVAGDEVARRKPDPEPYLRAARPARGLSRPLRRARGLHLRRASGPGRRLPGRLRPLDAGDAPGARGDDRRQPPRGHPRPVGNPRRRSPPAPSASPTPPFPPLTAPLPPTAAPATASGPFP